MKTLQTINISCIDNLIMESQKILEQTHPVKIVVRTSDAEGKENNVTLYQKQKYVLLTPENDEKRSLLYGNWEEALQATKRKIGLYQPETITIDHYPI